VNIERKEYPLGELVKLFRAKTLRLPDEYQRGFQWKPSQQQSLIDSILRGYPIPALFIRRITRTGLGGTTQEEHDIIDGQQRLTSLVNFFNNDFSLLEIGDSRLRLPASMRKVDVTWAGKEFRHLSDADRSRLQSTELLAYVISSATDDEVRDLFIRLQAGTPLSPQQVRDAWPGNIAPFINRVGGRRQKGPEVKFLGKVDKRGNRDPQDKTDRYVGHRQMCAQLLSWYIRRERDPNDVPSLGPGDLNHLYQEYSGIDVDAPLLERFQSILDRVQDVFDRYQNLLGAAGAGRTKLSKRDIFCVFSLIQDLSRVDRLRITGEVLQAIAIAIPDDGIGTGRDPKDRFRQDSPEHLLHAYNVWRTSLPAEALGIRLDPQRLFSAEQKFQVFNRQHGLCAVCRKVVEEIDAEYDHYPIRHCDGGPTTIDNCRLVHGRCHPRGPRVIKDELDEDYAE
jgi:hypothetical protein